MTLFLPIVRFPSIETPWVSVATTSKRSPAKRGPLDAPGFCGVRVATYTRLLSRNFRFEHHAKMVLCVKLATCCHAVFRGLIPVLISADLFNASRHRGGVEVAYPRGPFSR